MQKQIRVAPAPKDPVEMTHLGPGTPSPLGIKPSLHGLEEEPQKDPLQKDTVDNASWCCTITGLLCICAILLVLVLLMDYKVNRLMEKSKQERQLWLLKKLTLTEILKDMEIGKVPNCSICEVQWLQQAGKCFFFRQGQMGWRSSMAFCKMEQSSLAKPFTPVKMEFLRFYSSNYYHMESDKFWIGLRYNITEKMWMWADGTSFTSSPYVADLNSLGCVYLQNGMLYSQDCNKVAKLICERDVQFGWR